MNGLTIDDLAQRADVKVSTIRMYQHRQLLPPPTMRGRIGVYDDGHLARLRMIQRLQDQGFSLAGIGHLVAAWERGRTLGDLLDLDADAPVVVDEATLAELFPDGADPAVLSRLVELGVAERSDGPVSLTDARLLRVGRALAGTGLPLASVLDLAEQIAAHTTQIAAAFVALFEDHVWRPWVAAGMRGDDLADLLERLADLRTLGVETVAAAMRDAIDQAAHQAIADHADDLTG
ncbi:MAG TPA: MerR family transcriptional regulator [Euzebyales bacterium]|nr:MerR family transcriptional regulator [Euzebyales bacterium]